MRHTYPSPSACAGSGCAATSISPPPSVRSQQDPALTTGDALPLRVASWPVRPSSHRKTEMRRAAQCGASSCRCVRSEEQSRNTVGGIHTSFPDEPFKPLLLPPQPSQVLALLATEFLHHEVHTRAQAGVRVPIHLHTSSVTSNTLDRVYRAYLDMADELEARLIHDGEVRLDFLQDLII